MADDFCKFFNTVVKKHTLEVSGKRHRSKPNSMSDAEIITILIMFHSCGYRCLKHFYKEYIYADIARICFALLSYYRFVELEKEVLFPMTIFVKEVLLGKCTGMSFVDSTPLRVCRNQRIHCHRVFKGIAMRGKCSMGWFFGFKLHLIINEKGEILNFMVNSVAAIAAYCFFPKKPSIAVDTLIPTTSWFSFSCLYRTHVKIAFFIVLLFYNVFFEIVDGKSQTKRG